MASSPTAITGLAAELAAYAEPLVQSGQYTSAAEVLHAAMDALRQKLYDQAYDEACERAAEEGEASGLAEGDIFEQVRAELGLKSRTHA